jgi:hypothetical protein
VPAPACQRHGRRATTMPADTAMAGRSKSETISKSEYQMTKTFPALLQYLFETLEDILCFEFGIWVIRICFGLPCPPWRFGPPRRTTKPVIQVWARDFVLRVSDLPKIDYANKFVTSGGYLFK